MPRAARPPTPAPLRCSLDPVPSTLCIPLAARAFGDALFPAVAVGDAHAAAALTALGDDGQAWLEDRASVYGVLARTRVFRALAQGFFAEHAQAQGVNLGCGLSHYTQWLAPASPWLDTDLPPVLALRRRVLPALAAGVREQAVDLRERGWWQRLELPSQRPVFAMCEGVLMYLEPAEVEAFFAEIDRHAASGSVIVFDSLCWLAVGQARWHPSVRLTAAEFRWGPHSIAEVVAPHARLQVAGEHSVMDGYGWPHAFAGSAFRWFTGGPFYGVTKVVVR